MRPLFGLGRKLAFGIDLGTANTLICSTAGEIIVDEPSVVTIRQRTGTVESIGTDAHRAIGRTPLAVEPAHPVRSGVVADLSLAETLLRRFIKRRNGSFLPGGISAAVAVPCGVTDVERFAVLECVRRAGVNRAVLVEQVLAAAHGCGVKVGVPRGAMVIDVGAGLMEIGVFSLGAIVVSRTEPVAGNAIDHSIVEHVRNAHRLLIGSRTAELIKSAVGSAASGGGCSRTVQVSGRCLVHGLPRTVTLDNDEISAAVAPVVAAIVRVARSTFDAVPPELSADLIETGAVLTGGTALLPGLAERLARELKVAVQVHSQPRTSVAVGLSRIIGDARLWQRAQLPLAR
jgi:rod shape-determining protein MreB